MDTVNRINQEMKEKDMFIQRLRRSSTDLQDIIADTEQTYIKDLNYQKKTIDELKKENLTVLTRNQELLEENEIISTEINRLINEVDEFNIIRTTC